MGLIRVLNVASNTSDFENIDLKALSQERELEIKEREAQDELGYDDDEEEADEGSNTFIFPPLPYCQVLIPSLLILIQINHTIAAISTREHPLKEICLAILKTLKIRI